MQLLDVELVMNSFQTPNGFYYFTIEIVLFVMQDYAETVSWLSVKFVVTVGN